jgi:hypothetical protein
MATRLAMDGLLTVLYGSILRNNPSRPDWPERDRFLLSKGHGASGLYRFRRLGASDRLNHLVGSQAFPRACLAGDLVEAVAALAAVDNPRRG